MNLVFVNMIISIAGCGWFGQSFAKSLLQDGHRVKGSTTSPEKIDLLARYGIEPFLIRISADREELTDLSFFECDLLVIAIDRKSVV